MSLNFSFAYYNPTKILCGRNALVHLPYELGQLGVDLPFVMVDALIPSAVIKKIISAFKGSGITLALCEDISAEPNEKQLKDLAALYVQNSCNAIVAVGKDAAVNAARILALTLVDPESDPARFAGRDRIRTKLPPLVQVPFGFYSGNGALPLVRTKQWCAVSPLLQPELAVLDSNFYKTTDALQRFSCALITLSLCMESVAGKLGNPITESLAMSAVQSVMQYFTSLFAQKNHQLDDCFLARAQMTSGAVMAGSEPTVLPYLMEELSKTCDHDSGVVAGILLPHALEILGRKYPESVADLLMACQDAELFAVTAETLQARCTINTVYDLMQLLNTMTDGHTPTTLEDAGVPWKSLEPIARSAGIDREEIRDWDAEKALLLLTHAWRGIPVEITPEENFNYKHN